MSDGFAAFRHPGVARLAAGRFVSELGTTATSVAVGWQLYELTASKWALAWVGLVEVVPVVLLSLPAGIASDRYPRRHVAMATHLLMATAAAALMLVTHFKLDAWLFYPALFLTGVGAAFHGPAVRALLPQLVPPKEFANANAWFSSAYELAAISGPALAGFFIALSSNAQVAFGFAVASHLFFAAMLYTLPHKPAALTGASNGVQDLLAGFRFVMKTRVFLAAITLDLFAVLLGGAVALLPVYAKDVLHVGPEGLGWLRAAPSLGALCMALLQTRLKPWRRPGVALLWTVAGFGVATIAFGLSTVMWLSLVALFFTGVFDNVSVVIRSTLEQSLTPDAMRGRVSAINGVFIGLSNEFGAFESASVAALFTPLISVVAGGVGTLVVALVVLFVFPQLRTLPPLSELKPIQDN
jgi:MFS family permease